MSDMNIKRINGYQFQELEARGLQNKPEKSFSKLMHETASLSSAQSPSAPGFQDKRRQIAAETAQRWQASARQWRDESAGMDFADGVIYCNEKAVQWVTELMDSAPAMFRQWLSQERWHIQESGLDNAILPEGFTEEDMSHWMEKDVLDYL